MGEGVEKGPVREGVNVGIGCVENPFLQG